MGSTSALVEQLGRAQWRRGLRAAFVVGTVMTACHALRLPAGHAALGSYVALLVDNGGPYHKRLLTMLTVVLGGTMTYVVGALLPDALPAMVLGTMAVCFAVTFARAIAQPLSSASVLMLVLYFSGLGGVQHEGWAVAREAKLVLAGGGWGVLLSLAMWPIDPFRPARLAVADCYRELAGFTAELARMAGCSRVRASQASAGAGPQLLRAAGEAIHRPTAAETRESGGVAAPESSSFRPAADEGALAGVAWRRMQRRRIEEARAALVSTMTRAPSRTIRARNLTVLLETSDLLLARTVRLVALEESASGAAAEPVRERLADFAAWLAGAEQVLVRALERKPVDRAASFAAEGSLRLDWIERRRMASSGATGSADRLEQHLLAEQQEALLEMEVAFDAVRAIWTGAESQRDMRRRLDAEAAAEPDPVAPRRESWNPLPAWIDAARANWNLRSRMMRHALRLMVVGALDVIVMRLIHINHGYWLPMTSIILMQPYSAGTTRKSVQRVTGTVLGGMVAAALAAVVPSQAAMIPVIAGFICMALAMYSIDYALYSFFLTPTFVLLSLPHLHDWRYAGIRMATTLAGASIAIGAMRLLWPERAELELSRLLRRGAAANAGYLRAMLEFWSVPAKARRRAERELLAPARRACGLASADAEEAIDRVMQEPRFRRADEAGDRLRAEALTFATYLRRLTQSTTMLSAIGYDTPATHRRLERMAERLDGTAAGVPVGEDGAGLWGATGPALVDVQEEQMQRMERQTGVLERAAAGLPGYTAVAAGTSGAVAHR